MTCNNFGPLCSTINCCGCGNLDVRPKAETDSVQVAKRIYQKAVIDIAEDCAQIAEGFKQYAEFKDAAIEIANAIRCKYELEVKE